MQYASSLSLDEGTAGAHVSSLAQSLSRNIRDDFAVAGATEAIAISLSEGMHTNANESAASAHVTMYLGCMLTLLHSTLLEERGNQTREAYNLFLLYGLLSETEVLEDGQLAQHDVVLRHEPDARRMVVHAVLALALAFAGKTLHKRRCTRLLAICSTWTQGCSI